MLDYIRVEKSQGVGIVTLNRSDARFLLPGGGTSEILRLNIGRDLDYDRESGALLRWHCAACRR